MNQIRRGVYTLCHLYIFLSSPPFLFFPKPSLNPHSTIILLRFSELILIEASCGLIDAQVGMTESPFRPEVAVFRPEFHPQAIQAIMPTVSTYQK